MNTKQPQKSRWEKILRRLIPFISIGVLGNLTFTYFTTEKGHFEGWGQLSIGWLLVAMLLALLPWAWHCIRLRIWTTFFHTPIGWKDLLTIVVSTDVGSAVTPTAVGGAPLKLAMLTRYGMRLGHATLLTLIGNLEDVLFFVVITPISLWLTDGWKTPLLSKAGHFILENRWLALGTMAIALLLFVLMKKWWVAKKRTAKRSWKVKLLRLKKDFGEAYQLVRQSGWKPMILSMLALLGQWLTKFSVLIAVFLALGIEADFVQVLLLQWMVYFAILLVPTPGATGGAEAAFLFVYNGLIPTGLVSMVMATWRLVTYYFMLTVGVLLFMALTGVKLKKLPAVSS